MPIDVFEAARRYIAKMPDLCRAESDPQDSHSVLFTAACALVKGFELQQADALALLDGYARRSDTPWTLAELQHKIHNAEISSDTRGRGWLLPSTLAPSVNRPEIHRSAPEPKAEFKSDKLARFAARWRSFVNTAWLADRSPINPYKLPPADFLHTIYRPGEAVLIFTDQRSQGQALWPNERPPTSSTNGVWFLAQPVDGKFWENPRQLDEHNKPTMSRRSEESVTSWRFLVIESDEANPYDWTAALAQMRLPISAIYTSGKRSIHALVKVNAKTIEEWRACARALQSNLVTLGADRQVVATAVRLSRLPGCWRGNRLQKLLYLNDTPTLTPITQMPRLRDVLGVACRRAEVRHIKIGDVIKRAEAKNLDDCIDALDEQEKIKALDAEDTAELLRWFESAPDARQALALLTT
jgi:hypothetical protein